MLTEPERIESQFLGPFSHGQDFLVILLVGPTDLGGIVAEHENAKFHNHSSFVPRGLFVVMSSKCQTTVLTLRQKKYLHRNPIISPGLLSFNNWLEDTLKLSR